MKLEIDLMNADEVAAGLVLLGKIGEAQAEMKAAVRLPAQPAFADFNQRTQVPEGEEFYTPPQTQIAANIKDEHFVAGTTLDPAAVFGGTPVADPLPSSTTVPLPPVSIAPTTPIPGPVSSVAAVELDVKGLPWDSRIHSSSKNKLANGCWKVARGKAPEYVAQVEAELKGVAAVTKLGVPLPPVPVAPDVTPYDVALPTAADAAYMASIPPAPPGNPVSFETLMTRISPQISAGVLPPQAVMEACKANGLQSVVGLQSSPQLVPLVWATLKATYPALV